MMTRAIEVKVTMTETLHFQRLVQFLIDADDLASVNADAELRELVDECRDDLLGLPREERD